MVNVEESLKKCRNRRKLNKRFDDLDNTVESKIDEVNMQLKMKMS